MSGWVKLHRKMLEWEWYDDHNTKILYLHLLLSVNHTSKKWRGNDVPAGSIITGRHKLSEQTGLTEQQIRTCLEKLRSTNEITIKTTNIFSLISITNWNQYQTDGQPINQEATNEQPTDNQRVTTTKEGKKVKNEKEDKEQSPMDKSLLSGLDFSPWPNVPSLSVLRDYKKTRGTQLTQTAINRMAKEINKAHADGVTADECLSVCCEAGWQGFKYDWYLNREKVNGTTRQSSSTNRHQEFLDNLKAL